MKGNCILLTFAENFSIKVVRYINVKNSKFADKRNILFYQEVHARVAIFPYSIILLELVLFDTNFCLMPKMDYFLHINNSRNDILYVLSYQDIVAQE